MWALAAGTAVTLGQRMHAVSVDAKAKAAQSPAGEQPPAGDQSPAAKPAAAGPAPAQSEEA
jgi:hypothetical protein